MAAPHTTERVRVHGQLSRGRFGRRRRGRRPHRAREFPAPPPAAILDDSVFALYLPVAWRARSQPVAVTGIFPRAGRREVLAVQDPGTGATTLKPHAPGLPHITGTGGANQLVHPWVCAGGRLLK